MNLFSAQERPHEERRALHIPDWILEHMKYLSAERTQDGLGCNDSLMKTSVVTEVVKVPFYHHIGWVKIDHLSLWDTDDDNTAYASQSLHIFRSGEERVCSFDPIDQN